MKILTQFIAVIATAIMLSGCATLTESPMTTIALSFGNGESGECTLTNKRAGEFQNRVDVPATVSVRKSDDDLVYRCRTSSGKTSNGAIPSRMGGKIVASAVFLDFGIVDAITDNHREYPPVFVIPVGAKSSFNTNDATSPSKSAAVSTTARDLLEPFNAPKRTVSWTAATFYESWPGLYLESSSYGQQYGLFGIGVSPCNRSIAVWHVSKPGRHAFRGIGETAWVAVNFGNWTPIRDLDLQGARKEDGNRESAWLRLRYAYYGDLDKDQYIHVGLRINGKDLVLPFSLTKVRQHLHKFECA